MSDARTALGQYAALSRRAITNTVRQPAAVLPSFLFPLMFLALLSASLNRSTSLPGFPPVDSFFQFMITTSIVQGALFGSIAAGSDMAVDIEGGFFERLIASPVARTSILVGRVTGAATIGFVQAWWFMAVGLIFGLDIEGGLAGMIVISLAASMIAAGIGAISVALAIRTGSSEAVQGSFPLMFTLLFLSSAFFPRDLMTGWFKTLATANPFSYLIEGLRTQIIAGFDGGQAATAIGIAAALFALGTALSAIALRARLAGPS